MYLVFPPLEFVKVIEISTNLGFLENDF